MEGGLNRKMKIWHCPKCGGENFEDMGDYVFCENCKEAFKYRKEQKEV